VDNGAGGDTVFKYRADAGLRLARWSIDPANTSPTGITIDPTGGSQSIWIVDRDLAQVFEYGNARGNTGGLVLRRFALAAGNTRPEDIADPPVDSAIPTASTKTKYVADLASLAWQMNICQRFEPRSVDRSRAAADRPRKEPVVVNQGVSSPRPLVSSADFATQTNSSRSRRAGDRGSCPVTEAFVDQQFVEDLLLLASGLSFASMTA
jgi:hypothetical protein